MKKIIVLLVLGILLLGCTSYNTPANPPATPNQTPPPSGGSGTPSAGSATVTVHIKGFAFTPVKIVVNKGDTVQWVNDDATPHQVKFPDFESAVLGSGDTFEHEFDASGEFAYSCAIHPSMQGAVSVK